MIERSFASKACLRDALDHVLAIPCICEEEKRCHRCNAGLLICYGLEYKDPQAHAIVSGETTVTRLELQRLRMEYAAALQQEMGAKRITISEQIASR